MRYLYVQTEVQFVQYRTCQEKSIVTILDIILAAGYNGRKMMVIRCAYTSFSSFKELGVIYAEAAHHTDATKAKDQLSNSFIVPYHAVKGKCYPYIWLVDPALCEPPQRSLRYVSIHTSEWVVGRLLVGLRSQDRHHIPISKARITNFSFKWAMSDLQVPFIDSYRIPSGPIFGVLEGNTSLPIIRQESHQKIHRSPSHILELNYGIVVLR